MLFVLPLLLLTILPRHSVFGWPDGAPCLRTVYHSMNPLEAVEHQGGLQLSEPPYAIEVDAPCYFAGQAISVTLSGNGSTHFKGFAIQPLVFEQGMGTGTRRTGQFVRMDDNGSWQFQCFRIRDSITHSHDDGKGRIRMWWRGDFTGETVQFVATVVQNLKRFWVKSVVSAPIPSCSMRASFGPWNKPPPTAPPPTDTFKQETFQLFNGVEANRLISELSAVPLEAKSRGFPRPLSQNQLASVFFRTPEPASTPAPITFAPVTPSASFSRVTFTFAPSPMEIVTPSFFRPRIQFQPFGQNSACRDRGGMQCRRWRQFCPTNLWMSQFCKATCGMC